MIQLIKKGLVFKLDPVNNEYSTGWIWRIFIIVSLCMKLIPHESIR